MLDAPAPAPAPAHTKKYLSPVEVLQQSHQGIGWLVVGQYAMGVGWGAISLELCLFRLLIRLVWELIVKEYLHK